MIHERGTSGVGRKHDGYQTAANFQTAEKRLEEVRGGWSRGERWLESGVGAVVAVGLEVLKSGRLEDIIAKHLRMRKPSI